MSIGTTCRHRVSLRPGLAAATAFVLTLSCFIQAAQAGGGHCRVASVDALYSALESCRTIRLSAGTYALTSPLRLDGQHLRGSQEMVFADEVPVGVIPGTETVLDASGLDLFDEPAVEVSQGRISRLTVSGSSGYAVSVPETGPRISADHPRVSLRQVVLENSYIGGLFAADVYDSTLRLSFDAVLVSSNALGLILGGGPETALDVTIRNTRFYDNFAALLPIGATDQDGGEVFGRSSNLLFDANYFGWSLEGGTDLPGPDAVSPGGRNALICWTDSESRSVGNVRHQLIAGLGHKPSAEPSEHNTVRVRIRDADFSDPGAVMIIDGSLFAGAGNDIEVSFSNLTSASETPFPVLMADCFPFPDDPSTCQSRAGLAGDLETFVEENSGLIPPAESFFTGERIDWSPCRRDRDHDDVDDDDD